MIVPPGGRDSDRQQLKTRLFALTIGAIAVALAYRLLVPDRSAPVNGVWRSQERLSSGRRNSNHHRTNNRELRLGDPFALVHFCALAPSHDGYTLRVHLLCFSACASSSTVSNASGMAWSRAVGIGTPLRSESP